jgi:hypothetical protein
MFFFSLSERELNDDKQSLIFARIKREEKKSFHLEIIAINLRSSHLDICEGKEGGSEINFKG